MNKNAKIGLGILAAVTAGVAIGLLIAPEKGKDIRKKIRSTAGGWVDSVGNFIPFVKRKKNKLEAGADVPTY